MKRVVHIFVPLACRCCAVAMASVFIYYPNLTNLLHCKAQPLSYLSSKYTKSLFEEQIARKAINFQEKQPICLPTSSPTAISMLPLRNNLLRTQRLILRAWNTIAKFCRKRLSRTSTSRSGVNSISVRLPKKDCSL